MGRLVLIIVWASYFALVNNAITALYPLKAAALNVHENSIGQVLGIYYISNLAFLPLSKWMMNRCSELTAFQIGLTLLALTLVIVACLPTIQNVSLFVALSFFFRIMEGAADIIINMAAINMIQKAKNKHIYLNLMIGFTSLASAAGALLVSLLEASLGFTGFYLSLSGLVLSSAIICRIWHSYFTNEYYKEKLLSNLESQNDTATSLTDRFTLQIEPLEASNLSFLQILKIKRVFVGLIFFMAVASMWSFRDPILPVYLKSRDLQNEEIENVFLIQRLTNSIFGLTPLLFVKLISPRCLILSGSVGITISLFLIGPSTILDLGNSLILQKIGLGLLGATFNYATCPVLTSLIESIKQQYPQATNFEKLSPLFLAARSLGYWMGSLLGSIVYEKFNFAMTCDIFAIFFIFLICVYSDLFCSIIGLCKLNKLKQGQANSYHRLNGGAETNSI